MAERSVSVGERQAARERLKLRIGTVVWFVLLLGLALALPIVFDIGWWAALALLVLALVLALPVTWVVRRLFAGQRRVSRRKSYLKSALAGFALLAAAVAAPVYALAINSALNPMTVPLATLTNGSKTVMFQGMSHVGTESFYKGVVYDLEVALNDGYVVFYEGVQDDPRGDDWFSRTLAGGGDLSASYQSLGSTCGLVFQLDYFRLLSVDRAAHPERHVDADVTTAQMMDEYQRLIDTDPDFAAYAAASSEPEGAGHADTSAQLAGLVGWVERATPGQRAVVGTLCRGLMNYALGGRSDRTPIDRVVLDFRNRELAARIAGSPADKIYITYGAGHLPGLMAELQALDPAWEIASVKWMRTIDAPDDLSGEI